MLTSEGPTVPLDAGPPKYEPLFYKSRNGSWNVSVYQEREMNPIGHHTVGPLQPSDFISRRVTEYFLLGYHNAKKIEKEAASYVVGTRSCPPYRDTVEPFDLPKS